MIAGGGRGVVDVRQLLGPPRVESSATDAIPAIAAPASTITADRVAGSTHAGTRRCGPRGSGGV